MFLLAMIHSTNMFSNIKKTTYGTRNKSPIYTLKFFRQKVVYYIKFGQLVYNIQGRYYITVYNQNLEIILNRY